MSSRMLPRSLCRVVTICVPAALLTVISTAAQPLTQPSTQPWTQRAAPVVSGQPTPISPTIANYDVDGVNRPALARLAGPTDALVALTAPQPVRGFATVGLTWDAKALLRGASLWVRTYDDAGWSRWQQADAEVEDAPDPDSAEARGQRPGTEPLVIGEVQRVRAKVHSGRGVLPAGLALSVIDPGTAPADAPLAAPAFGATSAPPIFTRQQWGADESLRNGDPRYGSVEATVVHHSW
ncbi:hypothetical protein BH24ACT12_BH24ACT12_24120 [soil metagenome]